jgi:adenylate kinase
LATIVPVGNIVLFGRPGSGKSSLAEKLAVDFGMTLVRTGELLRAAVRRGDDLGRRVETALKAGELVPDELVFNLLAGTLDRSDEPSLLFDGFPRTLGQVPLLERLQEKLDFKIDTFVEIAVSHDAAITRMEGRRVCPQCGATYHVLTQPPRVADVCDRDGVTLERRRDDSTTVIARRQVVYEASTGPVADHYRNHVPDRFLAIDGERPFDLVYEDLVRRLKSRAVVGGDLKHHPTVEETLA